MNERELVHTVDASRHGPVQSSFLAVVPLHDVKGYMWGLVAVQEMPFFSK